MADNYRQFAEVIEGLNDEEADWLESELENSLDACESDEERDARRAVIEQQFECDEPEYWPDFNWEVAREPGKKHELRVFAEDHGSVEDVAGVVRAFLRKFRPKDSFILSWSDTCSKLRTGEFDGGAIFVTAQGVEFLQASAWAQFKQEEWTKRNEQTKSR